MQIAHVVPPVAGGVMDFARILVDRGGGASTIPLSMRAAHDCELPQHVLLHYSGYGYARRGAPLWLLRYMSTQQRRGVHKLGIFFHELFAGGSPLGSAFWLSPVQRHVASKLAQAADFWMTNSERSAQWLRTAAGAVPNSFLPVFSNVGESASYVSKRSLKVVIFGGAQLRASTYRAAGGSLFDWARERGLELHDIGPPIDDLVVLKALRRADVVLHGRLEAAEVSKHLDGAMYGILAYPIADVAKSGVFAAYCSHGVGTILYSRDYTSSDALKAGHNYHAGMAGALIGDAEKVGSAAWHWYQSHRVAVHVESLRNHMVGTQ